MGDFHEYYEGKLRAPVPTIFIGGNHEASNYLFDLYHGGWVCPNIYFLGYSGVVRFGGIRIGGLSGIYNPAHYDLGYYERAPYNGNEMRSIYHYRRFETFKLSHLKQNLDIFISHEWPTGIYHYGDTKRLLEIKPYFKEEVQRNELGAKPLEELLFRLKPKRWLSAHMHVHFEATVPHPGSASGDPGTFTQFLALDKCLPKRKFLKILDVPGVPSEPLKLKYDPEWLQIVRASDEFMSVRHEKNNLPSSFELKPLNLSEEQLLIPEIFTPTASNCESNPQTDQFCKLLGISNKVSRVTKINNPDEIDLDLVEFI